MKRSIQLIVVTVFTLGLSVPAVADPAAPTRPIDPGPAVHRNPLEVDAHAAASGAVAAETSGRNLLQDGSVERGRWTAAGSPPGWTRAGGPGSRLTWSRSTAHGGRASLRIENTSAGDAYWQQTVRVTPHAQYRLSGWIRTDAVQARPDGYEDPGANLSADAPDPQYSPGVFGSRSWVYRTVLIRADDTGTLTVRARLGSGQGHITGTAWFDDLQLAPVLPSPGTHPAWRILAIAYDRTEVDLPAGGGTTHHAVGHYDRAQRAELDAAVRGFAYTDVPALTSGNLRPRLTIQHQPLAPLVNEPYWGWLVRAADVNADPGYDAVMVLFPNVVTDQSTGASQELDGTYLGLTDGSGTRQTFSLMLGNTAVGATNRAVFKHEFGHAILNFHDAAGDGPRPTVDNHEPASYVHCHSGRPYVLGQEEGDDAHPVTNGIYDDRSSFTHDYYSGTTALATDPTTCLGVDAASWELGGPVTMPIRTLAVQAREIGVAVQDLVDEGLLTSRRGADLKRLARQTSTDLRTGRSHRALAKVRELTRRVDRLHRRGHLEERDAHVLDETASLLLGQLTGR